MGVASHSEARVQFSASEYSRHVSAALISALAYAISLRIGFAFKPSGEVISALWPANAVLLAILTLVPRRTWWLCALAAMPVHLVFQVGMGTPIDTALGWYAGNICEALLGAFCIRKIVDPGKLFATTRGVIVFLVFAVLAAPLFTSFLDVTSVVFTRWDHGFWKLWWERFLSNALSELIFVPLIVSLRFAWTSRERATARQFLEAFSLSASVMLTTSASFALTPRVMYPIILFYLPACLLLWAVLRFGLPGLSVSLATVAIIALAGAMQNRGPFASDSVRENIVSVQFIICALAIPLIVLASVLRERKSMEQSLRELAQRLIGAQEQERIRIARELHDDVAQSLALANVRLEQMQGEPSLQVSSRLAVVLELLNGASTSIRELSHGLHPSHLEYVGFESAIRRLCQDASVPKLLIACTVENLHARMRGDVALCLYRIAQEALQNVIRHSGASRAQVAIREDRGSVLLTISDNGTGFVGRESASGIGILGMRERLRMVGGDINICSSPGEGTAINVVVTNPW